MRFIYRATLVVLAVAALCGCETFQQALHPPASSLPWTVSGKADLCSENCTKSQETEALLRAASHCLAIYQYHGQYAGAAGAAQWTLGSLGTLAGSVFAPIAHGNAAKAWAGLSGATNALQLSMNNAFSATVELNRQRAVAKATKDGLEAFQKAAVGEKFSAAVAMSLGCATAGAMADAETLIKLNTAVAPVGTPDAAKPDVGKPDAAKPDAAKPDVAKPDVGKPDVAKPGAAKPDFGKPGAVTLGAGTPAAGAAAPQKRE
ncbi:hypothetical protein [Variovorax paradoxus]|uniref:hypothetical protein n=1 Tax=Variovorax paradoxus TaxID=34073 RepID=UPI0029C917D5|nr:hypothetical protein [Variovorax paradoxus]WPH22333.1 hypothetical protein RZE78_09250 [Variovorax paradoxus]